MTTYYFNIYKQIKQLELELLSSLNIKTYNTQFAKNQLVQKISQNIDILMLVLYPI